MHTATIILAAGRGLRAGGTKPKQYALLGGVSLLRRTVKVFLDYYKKNNSALALVIIVMINSTDDILCRESLGDLAGKVHIVHGGATRQESALNGLRFLGSLPQVPAYVHIHDGARPFIQSSLLDALEAALTQQNGALPALPVVETLKRVNADHFIEETVPRSKFYAAQTPQSFPFIPILNAHEAAAASGRRDFTDDSALAEAYGLPVKQITGADNNIKITRQNEITMADIFFQNQEAKHQMIENCSDKPSFPDIRTGNGYDVHKLGTGSDVIRCGVKIPSALALQGHSDADVALHALTDALLATCGAGDIGIHFPPSDPQWKNAASEIFVRHAVQLLTEKGGQIINVDITLIAEAPKIAPHRPAMVKALQSMLDVSAERISVKATTNETLGFIGREEGIAAIATANVFYK